MRRNRSAASTAQEDASLGDGKITTFYSFKGGVGRSMALANVAFIAAMNHHRVLVMDWDLEAPGLGNYFRGLLDPSDWRALKNTPGVLDMAWDWVTKVRETKDGRELNAYIERYISGYAFDDLVRPLLDDPMQDAGYALDILSAGSDHIGGKYSYEEALSVFSWPDFFSKDAGGVLLEALRDWAKDRYDIILVDSRTGMADVAGICTMQIPDTVALCFILNRQNMEGVARVAGAIRAKRSEEINLRIVPMRLTSQGTSEEADALARARRELTMFGGFASDAVNEDVQLLGVKAAAGIPFYEAIAPIMAADPLTDPLSQNYLALASNLLCHDFTMPDLAVDWAQRVRDRLKPSHATPDYLVKLKASDPQRAFYEVSRLVESALDAQIEHDSDLDDEYVEALIRMTFTLGDEAESPFDAALLLRQAADLARARLAELGADWRPLLVETMANLVEYAAYLDEGEELTIIEELDALLVPDQTIQGKLTRLRHRRRAARLYIQDGELEPAFQAIADIVQLNGALQTVHLSGDQHVALLTGEAEAYLLRGDAYCEDGAFGRAIQEYFRGHALPAVKERSEFARLRYDFATRLATRFPDHIDSDRRSNYALEAAIAGTGQSWGTILFAELGELVIDAPHQRGRRLQIFVEAMLNHGRLRNFGTIHGRQGRTAARFFDTTAKMVEILRLEQPEGWPKSLSDLARAAEQVARVLIARRATVSSRSNEQPVSTALGGLIQSFQRSGMSELAHELAATLDVVDNRLRRQRSPRDIGPGDGE